MKETQGAQYQRVYQYAYQYQFFFGFVRSNKRVNMHEHQFNKVHHISLTHTSTISLGTSQKINIANFLQTSLRKSKEKKTNSFNLQIQTNQTKAQKLSFTYFWTNSASKIKLTQNPRQLLKTIQMKSISKELYNLSIKLAKIAISQIYTNLCLQMNLLGKKREKKEKYETTMNAFKKMGLNNKRFSFLCLTEYNKTTTKGHLIVARKNLRYQDIFKNYQENRQKGQKSVFSFVLLTESAQVEFK
eukprot:TRINITY_DN3675_c0_g1_i1.p2 TRINITY_DN3675_c0_g1~~TRINITY_DN3675_c0_g1_i1.p2  ORF type:complete len:244 (+),score=-3.80 TRINITY_DN3675_c0_g1_i1:352-1083(+)